MFLTYRNTSLLGRGIHCNQHTDLSVGTTYNITAIHAVFCRKIPYNFEAASSYGGLEYIFYLCNLSFVWKRERNVKIAITEWHSISRSRGRHCLDWPFSALVRDSQYSVNSSRPGFTRSLPAAGLCWRRLAYLSVNSSPPSATYMHMWIGSALIQIMACRLFGVKPLSKPTLACC